MAQLVHMDACLDTLSDKLCQANTRVGLITQQQAVMGGYTMASSLSRHLRIRVMAPVVLMMLRMMMMARLVMMRCLLDLLALCNT